MWVAGLMSPALFPIRKSRSGLSERVAGTKKQVLETVSLQNTGRNRLLLHSLVVTQPGLVVECKQNIG